MHTKLIKKALTKNEQIVKLISVNRLKIYLK